MAITFGTSTQASFAADGTFSTMSVSFDAGALTNGLLVVPVIARLVADRTFTATFGGQAMTMDLQSTYTNGGVSVYTLSMFSQVAPPSGAQTLEITANSTVGSGGRIVAFPVSFNGALQTSPLDVAVGSSGRSSLVTLEVTPTQNNEVIIAAYQSENNSTLVVQGAETNYQDLDLGGFVFGGTYIIQGTASTQTMDWKGGVTTSWFVMVTSYQQAAGGEPPVTAYPNRFMMMGVN